MNEELVIDKKAESKTSSSSPSNERRTDSSAKNQMKKLIKENEIEFVDLRFTDLRGKEHHVTLPENKIDDNFFVYGKAFDGSSICGWQAINESDLLLIPDASTAILD